MSKCNVTMSCSLLMSQKPQQRYHVSPQLVLMTSLSAWVIDCENLLMQILLDYPITFLTLRGYELTLLHMIVIQNLSLYECMFDNFDNLVNRLVYLIFSVIEWFLVILFSHIFVL